MKKLFGKLKRFALNRKRRFYIILIIIFTIVLILDIGIGKLMPDTSSMGSFPGMTGFSSDMTLPDTDSSDSSSDTSSDDASADDSTGSESSSDDTSDSEETDGTDSSDSSDSSDTDGGDSDFAQGGSLPDGASMPDMDSSDGEMPDVSDSEMPDMSDSEMAAGGAAGGTMPDFDASDGNAGTDSSSDSADSSDTLGDAQDADSDTADESADASADAFTSQMSGVMRVMAVMQVIKRFWILILVIAAAIDAFSIFMLIQLRKKARAERELEEKLIAEAELATGEVHIKRPAEKKKVSPIVWVIIVAGLIILVLLVKVLSSMTGGSSSQTEATVYTETVSTSDISTVLPGTGTLSEEDAEAVSIPSEVEITEWYVSNGDTVEEGDTLAKVDTSTALTAIASVQEVLDTLDEAIAEAEDSDTTGTVTATAAGRVKAIYAQTDTTVIDTIYDSGSLMLLSLDGLMAVEIETDEEVSAGDEVTVILSDSSEVTGTVESSINGTVVVTLTDEGTDLGDSVTVEDSDGNELGSGELYIHSELKILAFSGTVSSISVSVEDEVSSGDTLLSLTDVDNTLEVQLLLEQRSTLEDQIAELFTLYQDGYLYAESSGIVSGLSTDSSSDDDSEDTSDSEDSSDSDDSSDSGDSDTDSSESTDTSSLGSHAVTASYSGTSGSFTAASYQGGTVITTSSSGAQVITLSAASSETSDTESDSSEDESSDDDSDTEAEDDTSSEDTDDESTDTAYTNYLGIVTAIDGETASMTVYPISSSLSGSGISVTADLQSAGIYAYTDGTLASADASAVSAGDSVIMICSSQVEDGDTLSPMCVIVMSSSASSSDEDSSGQDESGEGGYSSGDDSAQSTDETSDMSGYAQGSDGSDSASSDASLWGSVEDADTSEDASLASALEGSTDASGLTADASASAEETSVTETLTEEVSTTYSVDETTWLSITPQDYMYITITIDELDILSIETGLTAEVTLDAFPGQSFEGVVESIDLSGTNEGGNSKYTAVIRIDREDSMLDGMNASVKITLETQEDVLCIPVEALVEDETGTYVYTSYDEKTDTLGDLVEVETGLSDGDNVEITSGLSEGDTYCYSVLDTVNYSSTTATGTGGFSFGSFGSFGGGGGF